MHARWFSCKVFVITILALATQETLGQILYWTDGEGKRISRAMTDGTSRQDIITNVPFASYPTNVYYPVGIALDLMQRKIYWTDDVLQIVSRSNLDGTEKEALVYDAGHSGSIALNLTTQKMYWVDVNADHMRRADLNGQNMEIILAPIPLVDLRYVAIDQLAGHLYLSGKRFGSGLMGTIFRVNSDGSNLTPILGGLGTPLRMAVDSSAGKIYWADSMFDTISRSNLDGTNVESIVSGIVNPISVALDVAGSKLFWIEAHRIARCNLDGSNIESVITTNLASPRDLALDLLCSEQPDGFPCENLNECDSGDQCLGTDCVGTPISGPCDDGDQCTIEDQCVNGECNAIYDPGACFHFFLQVTEVNGAACPSCPTANLPTEEVRPGDVLTIEAYLENWEDDPDSGLCDSHDLCSVSAQDCQKMHCANQNSWGCTTDVECGVYAPCVPEECWPAPSVGAYQFSLDYAGLSAGLGGYLSPLEVPCDSDSDCEHDLPVCTCDGAVCNNSVCTLRGTLFIDGTRPDRLVANTNSILLLPSQSFQGVGAVVVGHGVLDPGHPVYLGTILLKVSEDARGSFTVDVGRGISDTFVNDENGARIRPLAMSQAMVNLCETLDSSIDCNNNEFPDECEPDCNANGVPDECDITACSFGDFGCGDCDSDGVPNECDDICPPKGLHNRYITFTPGTGETILALRVEKQNLGGPGGVGGICWVDQPDALGIAKCVSTPVFRVWTEPEIHVGDCEIVPAARYHVQSTIDEILFDNPRIIDTIAEPILNLKKWADVAGINNGAQWMPPNLFTNVNDILAVLAYISDAAVKPEFQRVNLGAISSSDPCLNAFVNTADVLIVVKAVAGDSYPFTTNPANCPVCP